METLTKKKANISGTLETIYERRAVRKYKHQTVDRKIIEQIIDAGRMAPSAINKQPWKFYILTDKDLIHSFSKEIGKVAAKGVLKTGVKGIINSLRGPFHLLQGIKFVMTSDPVFHGAPVVIFITAPKENEWASLDVGMCAQNMMLAAKTLGLETCPIGFAKFVEQTNLYSKLNIPDSEHVLLAIILGYGDEKPEVHERKKDNVIYIDPL